MAGINSLVDIYNKRGNEFLESLLNSKVRVTEKISGHKFSFRYNGKEFIFYKRDLSTPLTKIDRIMVKLYEEPIGYIENLSDEIKSQLSSNYRYSFEYFPNQSPNHLTYQNLPKNNLILTHIVDVDATGNKIDSIIDSDVLFKWANILDVSPPPVIFEGKLNDKQKNKIMEYVRLPYDSVKKRFKDKGFTQFIIGVLNPEMKKTLLNNTLDNPIEGIVFSFNNETTSFNAKLIDPYFNHILKNNEANKPNDLYAILYSDIIEFMELNLMGNTFKLKSLEFDERYIELISRMFNKFIKNYGDKYRDVHIDVPKYLKRSEFDLNPNFIKDPKTLKYIYENVTYNELFKIFINLFRKKKTTDKIFLSPKVKNIQNDLVDYIFKIITDIKEENSLIDYENFISYFYQTDQNFIFENEAENDDAEDKEDKEDKEDEIEKTDAEKEDDTDAKKDDEDDEKDEKEDDKKPITKSSNNTGMMKAISFWQYAFVDEYDEYELKGKPRNIFISRFQPFTKYHLEVANEFYNKNKTKIILVQIHPKKDTKNRPFDINFSKMMLETIVQSNPNIFETYFIIDDFLFETIKNVLLPKYGIKSIIGNKNQISNIRCQLEYEYFYGLKKDSFDLYDFSHDFNSNYKHDDLLDAISKNDYTFFKNNMPKELYTYFDVFRHQIKN